MTINEFISHIKHKSLTINIFEGGKIWYLGDVGGFVHAVVQDKIGHRIIDKIEPIEFQLNIFIRGE